MNINVCKKILNSVLFFIAFMIVAFVINTFLFKFRFSETAPSIYEAIPGAIGGTLATAFFVKKDIKKCNNISEYFYISPVRRSFSNCNIPL